jgi:hypothetical protein
MSRERGIRCSVENNFGNFEVWKALEILAKASGFKKPEITYVISTFFAKKVRRLMFRGDETSRVTHSDAIATTSQLLDPGGSNEMRGSASDPEILGGGCVGV